MINYNNMSYNHGNSISEEKYRLRLEQLTEKDVAVFEELGDMPMKNVHAEAYIALLCIDGKASCKLEDNTLSVEKNDMLLAHPNQFIESAMMSCDFKCRGLLMSPNYFDNIFILGGNVLEASFIIREKPLFHLNERQANSFLSNFNVLRDKLAAVDMPHHDQIVKHMLQSMIYEFNDTISPMLDRTIKENIYSSAELIFKRFASMVSAETPKRREVNYYADKLCITSKYLSTICKKESGKTASEIINSLTINYISQMLRSSDKSIKQIASETGFDNLSFFGKYVRRELGVSPREYRTSGK